MTKCEAGRICRADLDSDSLRISRAYLRISDHCRVMVAVRVRLQIVVYKLLEKVRKCGSIT